MVDYTDRWPVVRVVTIHATVSTPTTMQYLRHSKLILEVFLCRQHGYRTPPAEPESVSHEYSTGDRLS